MKSGDMQIIGSLLYLVTVGVWVNENMDQPTQIGWALIVSICGKFDCKVGCAFPMVISSDFRMRKHTNDDHKEDAPYFIFRLRSKVVGRTKADDPSGTVVSTDH